MASEKPGVLSGIRHYPPAVFFMLGNEFCERFSFYGMKAILLLYFISERGFTESTASFLYHAFVALAFFSPLFGSIAADNYFGRFRVILWVSLVYVLGHALLSIGAIPSIPAMLSSVMDYFGLMVIALATGGMKPCVAAFAADQFDKSKSHERDEFFAFFYLTISSGAFVATMVTPVLRSRVKCFGQEHCFPLAFGVPGVLMLIAFVVFLCGWRFYKITPLGQDNEIWKVCKCLCAALQGKLIAIFRGKEALDHWLKYAGPLYNNKDFRNGVERLINVSLLFAPLVIIKVPFYQTGTTWVLQSIRMNGRVGPVTILPDQMQTFNGLFDVILVPIMVAFVYPVMGKYCKITTLRKIGSGGILVTLSVFMAGVLQLPIDQTAEPRPQEGNVFIHRIGNNTARYSVNGTLEMLLGKNEWTAGVYAIQSQHDIIQLNVSKQNHCYALGIYDLGVKREHSHKLFRYSCGKANNGKTFVYLMLADESALMNTPIFLVNSDGELEQSMNITSGAMIEIRPGFISSIDYTIAYGNCITHASNLEPNHCENVRSVKAKMGASYVLDLEVDKDDANGDGLIELVPANTINIMWQVPQYFVMAIGIVMVNVAGLEFSYTQAAPTMRSVMQAFWLLITFYSNVVGMLISKTPLMKNLAIGFFIYASLMVLAEGIFVALAVKYKYAEDEDEGAEVDAGESEVATKE